MDNRETSIGVFQNWGLGDLVMTVPVLVELRRLHPSARVVLMVRGKAQAALMEGSSLVDEILQVPPNSDRWAILRFFADLRRYHFDMVYVATRITPLAPLLLRTVAGVRTIVGDGERFEFLYSCRNRLDPGVHRVDRMLATLSLWSGVVVDEPKFELPIAALARRSASERLVACGLVNVRYIAFHPGSSRGPGLDKRVPVPLMKGVMDALRLRDPGLRFVVMFGPDDVDLIPRFEPFASDVTPMIGCSLDETKVVLSRAVGFLGSDSALGHIAASYGVPTVTAVGPTNPNETRPWGARSRVVASRETLPCRPCWFGPLQGRCPNERRCMTGITVQQILDELVLLPVAGGEPLDPAAMVATTEAQ